MPVLISSDQPGRMVAHHGGAYNFPFTGAAMEVPDHVGAHLLGVGGFSAAGPPPRQGDGPMWLKKAQGGTEITWRKVTYSWPEDGSVAEVPEEFGIELLSIRGGGYSVAEAPKSSGAEEPEPTADPGPDPEGDGDGDEGDGDSGEGGGGPAGDAGTENAGQDAPAKQPSRSRSRTSKA